MIVPLEAAEVLLIPDTVRRMQQNVVAFTVNRPKITLFSVMLLSFKPK